MEVLTAYLRGHAPAGPDVEESADTDKRLPADQQAVATVIGRRRRDQDAVGGRLDLHAVDLRGVQWQQAQLEGADLMWALHF
jgi:hypothetical protein